MVIEISTVLVELYCCNHILNLNIGSEIDSCDLPFSEIQVHVPALNWSRQPSQDHVMRNSNL